MKARPGLCGIWTRIQSCPFGTFSLDSVGGENRTEALRVSMDCGIKEIWILEGTLILKDSGLRDC